jgi:hypothetical protein
LRRGVAGAATLLSTAALVVAASGCGSAKTQNPTTAPTVSLWVNATPQDYRQVAAGAKLALAEAEGRAGAFRVNYAGRQSAALQDALENARTSLRDTQVSAVVTALDDAEARPAVTLLNSAGISSVVLGDDALKADACDAGSDIYPSGVPTAIVVPPASASAPGAALPAGFRSTFTDRLGFAPTPEAFRAYTGVKAVLSSLAVRGVATDDSPPRLDRDALAAALVLSHGGC